jgi:hypothetical protein
MKHKTWFRLVLKAIGILLIGMSLDEALTIVLQLADMFSVSGSHWTGMGRFANMSPTERFAWITIGTFIEHNSEL